MIIWVSIDMVILLFFPYEKNFWNLFLSGAQLRFDLLENDPIFQASFHTHRPNEAGSLMTVFFAALMGYTFSLMGRVCHVTGRISTRMVWSSFEPTTWGIPRNTLIGGLKQSKQVIYI